MISQASSQSLYQIVMPSESVSPRKLSEPCDDSTSGSSRGSIAESDSKSGSLIETIYRSVTPSVCHFKLQEPECDASTKASQRGSIAVSDCASTKRSSLIETIYRSVTPSVCHFKIKDPESPRECDASTNGSQRSSIAVSDSASIQKGSKRGSLLETIFRSVTPSVCHFKIKDPESPRDSDASTNGSQRSSIAVSDGASIQKGAKRGSLLETIYRSVTPSVCHFKIKDPESPRECDASTNGSQRSSIAVSDSASIQKGAKRGSLCDTISSLIESGVRSVTPRVCHFKIKEPESPRECDVSPSAMLDHCASPKKGSRRNSIRNSRGLRPSSNIRKRVISS